MDPRRIGGCLVLAVLLASCAGMRKKDQPAAVPVQPPVTTEIPVPATVVPGNSDGGGDTAPAADSDTPMPACLPAGTKPKPKPRPKPKPVAKEAPPQPVTAPVVAEAPPGALVDAQVRPINMSVLSILGKKVKGPQGDDLGRVVDVLADSTGRVRVAIIDFGGFLGVGNHRIAVDWPLLRFSPDTQEPALLLSVSADKLKSAPEYKDTPRPQILVPPTTPSAAPAPVSRAAPAAPVAPATPMAPAAPASPAAAPAVTPPPAPAPAAPTTAQ